MTGRFWMTLLLAGTLAVGLAWMGPVGKHAIVFPVVYVLFFGCTTLLVGWFPTNLSFNTAVGLIFCLGFGLRLLFIPYPPHLDVMRYVWEGYVQTQGLNPYLMAPDHPLLAPFRDGPMAPVWPDINHKDLSAAYGPLSLLIFKTLAALRPTPAFFKTVMLALDGLVVLPMAMLARHYELPPQRLLWYAANPLVLVFIAGGGHLDTLMALFMTLGVALILTGRPRRGFLILGGAGMIKYLALLALPFLIKRANMRHLLWAMLPLGLFIFYLDAGPRVIHSLTTFGLDLHYNDLLPAILRDVLNLPQPLFLTALILTGMLTWLYLSDAHPLTSASTALGLLLVCLPTLHPWYLILIAPFAALLNSIPWIYLQGAMAFTFIVLAVEQSSGIFQELHWLKALIYLPFVGLSFYRVYRGNGFWRKDRPPVHSVSVVIPTLNEADHIEKCFTSFENNPQICEIIVVDGGSVDNTLEQIRKSEVRTIHSRPGRGIQISEGVAAATGDVVLILHGDGWLRPGTTTRVIESLNRRPEAVGGAVAMRFDQPGVNHRLIAFLNNWRTRWTGIAFGDQAQFFRRSILVEMGGFPALMLMEDVELSLRLKCMGRVIFLNDGVEASGRRWRRSQIGTNLGLVLRLFVKFLIQRRWQGGISQSEDLGSYYYQYYPPQP